MIGFEVGFHSVGQCAPKLTRFLPQPAEYRCACSYYLQHCLSGRKIPLLKTSEQTAESSFIGGGNYKENGTKRGKRTEEC